MPRDLRRELLYLADIVESARTVARWLADRGEKWNEDEILRNAVLRQLSVVGEAASCLSDDVRGRLPGIPWREIRGFRNIAVHAYFSLDWDVVYEVATVNLPDLTPKVLSLLRVEDPRIAAKFGIGDEGREGDGGPVSEATTCQDEVASP